MCCRADADTEAVSSLSLEALTAKVEEWLPEAVGAGDSSDLTEALAADLRPAAFAEYEKALAAVFLAGAEVSCCPALNTVNFGRARSSFCRK